MKIIVVLGMESFHGCGNGLSQSCMEDSAMSVKGKRSEGNVVTVKI